MTLPLHLADYLKKGYILSLQTARKCVLYVGGVASKDCGRSSSGSTTSPLWSLHASLNQRQDWLAMQYSNNT